MRLLLAEKSLPVEDMKTAVYVAAENGCTEAMQLLLTQKGIDMNLKVDGKTPVVAAITSSPHECMCLQIKAQSMWIMNMMVYQFTWR